MGRAEFFSDQFRNQFIKVTKYLLQFKCDATVMISSFEIHKQYDF